jgi:hypothetical protein
MGGGGGGVSQQLPQRMTHMCITSHATTLTDANSHLVSPTWAGGFTSCSSERTTTCAAHNDPSVRALPRALAHITSRVLNRKVTALILVIKAQCQSSAGC